MTVLDIMADCHREGVVTVRAREGDWRLQVEAFPDGVAKHLRRRCEACGGPKRRQRAQFWVRWVNPVDQRWDSAHLACSFSCALKLRIRRQPRRGGIP